MDEHHCVTAWDPAETRPKMVNTHWVGDIEHNHLGTHEFMDLCDQLGAQPPQLRQRW